MNQITNKDKSLVNQTNRQWINCTETVKRDRFCRL